MSALLADPSAALKTPAPDDIAARVTAQLARDYPPGALSWVSTLQWQGPQQVPVTQIDRTAGKADWDAAAADKAKIQAMRKRIGAGFRKPVVAIRTPGTRLLYLMDGHSRAIASAELGVPVTAYIGTAKTAAGPWTGAHARQLANGAAGAIELVGPKGYIHGWIRPGGPLAAARSTAGTSATLGQLSVVHRQSTAYTDAKFAEQAAQIAVLHKRMAEMSDSKESHNAKLKIASHLGVAAGGAILSYALTKAGAPDLVGVATGFLSIGSQEAIDYVKRL